MKKNRLNYDKNALVYARSNLKQQTRFREAIPFQIELIRRFMQDGNKTDQANSWNDLGVLFRNSCKFAESAIRRALEIYATVSNPTARRTATYYFTLSQSLASLTRFNEAIEFRESAIRSWSSELDCDNPFLIERKEELTLLIAERDQQVENQR